MGSDRCGPSACQRGEAERLLPVAPALSKSPERTQGQRQPSPRLEPHVFPHVCNGRAILLLDNAANAEQVTPLIPPRSCLLLITSRQRFTLPGLHTKILDILPPHDACELLLSIAPRLGEHVSTLAQLCGYLPLALRITASTLAEHDDLDPSDYVQQLRDTQARLMQTGVHTSLQLSFDLLDAELQQCWCTLALFPETFDSQAAGAVWGQELTTAKQILGTLLAHSLLEWHPGTTRYRLHDLVRLFTSDRLRELEQTMDGVDDLGQPGVKHAPYERFVAYYRQFVSNYRGQRHVRTHDSVTKLEVEWRNVIAATEIAEKLQDWHSMSALVDELSDFLIFRGLWSEHEQLHRRVLEIACNISAPHMEGQVLHALGYAYVHQGRWEEAEQACQQSLAVYRKMHDRIGEGRVLSCLGFLYGEQGRWEMSVGLHQQSLAIHRESQNRIGEGRDLGAIGMGYTRLGRWEEAEQCYQQSLAIHRECSHRLDEGRMLNNLGFLYRCQGRWEEAEQCYQQSLAIARIIGNRVGEGANLHNLGYVSERRGLLDQAEEFFQQSLVIRLEVGDPNEGLTLSYLGLIRAAQGRWTEAKQLYEQGLAKAHNVGNLVCEAYILDHLGTFYKRQGDWEEAEQCYQQSLAIHQTLGNSAARQITLHNLCLVYAAQNRWEEAKPLYLQCLVFLRKAGDRLSAKRMRAEMKKLKRAT